LGESLVRGGVHAFVAVERDVLARWVALAVTAYFLWDVVA
jgi:hypothetical protein